MIPVANQSRQCPISNITPLENLASLDFYTHDHYFQNYCRDNYHQNDLPVPVWELQNVRETKLHKSEATVINHFIRDSDVKLFNVLNYVSTLTTKPVLVIQGYPRIGKIFMISAVLLLIF
jgi:hypothetical protein